MRARATTLVCLLGLVACKSSSVPGSNPPQLVTELYEAGPTAADSGASIDASNVTITLERTVCYGVCADYTVTLHGDGAVEYVGRQFVGRRGRVTDRIAPDDVAELVKKLDAAHFDRLSVPVPCPKGMATDNPTAILTVDRGGGRSHRVEHYHGNFCAPPELDVLEVAVDEVARTSRWTSCAPSEFCAR